MRRRPFLAGWPEGRSEFPAEVLSRRAPVVRAAGVVGKLNRPPPPAMVPSMLPLLQDADLTAGQQHRQPVMLLGRPHFAAPQRPPVKPDPRQGGGFPGATP